MQIQRSCEYKGIVLLQKNPVKHYQWGSTSKTSLVCSLATQLNQEYSNFAQLWMGIHKSGQSYLQNDKSLSEYMKQKKYGQLQFLLKVLSIEKCLSIQIHPTQLQAQILHNNNPKEYKDSNSKPQLFVVLSNRFQCFLGFIDPLIFSKLLSEQVFHNLQKCQNQTIAQTIIRLLQIQIDDQLSIFKGFNKLVHKIYPQRIQLYERLTKQYPNDIGIIISLFLQYKQLQKYDSFYIGANVPHAYISGQCLQIMKNSDNVVRLGLTPKFKDMENIAQLLLSQIPQPKQIIRSNMPKGQIIFSYEHLSIHIFTQINNKQIQLGNQSRIGIIIEGNFNIRTQNEDSMILQKGKIIYFEPHHKYIVSGIGQFCIGWSSF